MEQNALVQSRPQHTEGLERAPPEPPNRSNDWSGPPILFETGLWHSPNIHCYPTAPRIYPISTPVLPKIASQLSDELLSEIFFWCGTYIDVLGVWSIGASPSAERAPLLLCQVCQRWRKIILSKPKFWSSIAINTGKKRLPDSLLIELWIIRSRKHPLDIHLPLPDSSHNIRLAERFLRLFVLHIHRWRRVSLELNAQLASLLVPTYIHPESTHLEVLQLIMKDCPTVLTESILARLPATPNLSQFSFYNSTPFTSPAPLRFIPLSQLVHICLQCQLNPEECIYYLAQCTSAVSVELVDRGTSNLNVPHRNVPERWELPHLLTLRLSSGPRWDISLILPNFTLPSLTALHVNSFVCQRRIRGCCAALFEPFLERSKCALQTLVLIECSRDDDVLRFVKSPLLRSVEHLEVRYTISRNYSLVLPKGNEEILRQLRIRPVNNISEIIWSRY